MDVRQVDEFRTYLQAKGLGPRRCNMVLGTLAQILDDAVDYQLLDVNPARGRRRMLKVPKAPRSFLKPDMVIDLLDQAGAYEAALLPHLRYGRRALVALLCLAGLRIGEAVNLKVGQLDIHGGRLRVIDSKTDAGVRAWNWSSTWQVNCAPTWPRSTPSYAGSTGPSCRCFTTPTARPWTGPACERC